LPTDDPKSYGKIIRSCAVAYLNYHLQPRGASFIVINISTAI